MLLATWYLNCWEFRQEQQLNQKDESYQKQQNKIKGEEEHDNICLFNLTLIWSMFGEENNSFDLCLGKSTTLQFSVKEILKNRYKDHKKWAFIFKSL